MPASNAGSSRRWSLAGPEHVVGSTFDVLPKNVANPEHQGARS
jgi:hypothetical protein